MFKSITLLNYKSHKASTVHLSDVSLIIGSNNSGKSNFFRGVHFFSRVISQYNPDKTDTNYIFRPSSYYLNRHSLSKENEPMGFQCTWFQDDVTIKYSLSVNPIDLKNISCKEEMSISTPNSSSKITSGFDKIENKLLLRSYIKKNNVPNKDRINDFFQDLSSFYYYNFQPSFLKGEGVPYSDKKPYNKKDYVNDYRETKWYPNIPSELGKEGASLQEILLYIKQFEEETYNKFIGYLKRFVKNFNGLVVKDSEVKWQFDMGGANFPMYEPENISDGLVKASAVALLCSLKRPPSLIMIEEVENGINQKKISEFISWLIHASDGSLRTQFILSSHSPSVIREFSDKLDCVYNIHLRERDFVSRVTNLNDAIKPLVNMGTISDDGVFTRNGVEVVKIRPFNLVELFYNGVLGEL